MQNLKKPLSTSTSSPSSEDAPEVTLDPTPDTESGTVEHGRRHTAPDTAHQTRRIQFNRFRRIVVFFLLMFYRWLVLEIVLRRLLGEKFVARRRSRRYRNDARRFRKLAIEMGGVMIKLGQFVSSRVDVLPPEITEELADLQDQVPIVDFDYIKKTIEHELGPIEEKFAWLTPEPVAAASFGQVHRAQLPDGDRVVVKVQRPNISDLVHTDLSALSVVARLAMRIGPIRRRANVPALLEEFSRVLWEELDYLAEADHAMAFASMFKDDPGIYVPGVYLTYTTPLVLTLEDVTSIKINDYSAIDRAGVDRKEVASRLLACYLHQIFDVRFFHADPHPGNLFVYPLPIDNQDGTVPKNRPFYLIFVDFGMVGRLTPQLQEGLRETLIAVATQDAKALVASYLKLGVLLPGTDVKRLEDATRAVFDKVWGLNMSQLANMPLEEMTEVAREFSDLLLSMPFQMPQDFIYLSRAVGILSGMCTGLDPQFDPWQEMQPFTEQLLDQNSNRLRSSPGRSVPGSPTTRAALGMAGTLLQDFARRVYKLPALTDNVLSRADRGELEVKMMPGDGLQRQINRIEVATGQIALGVVFATITLASTILYVNQEHGLGIVGYVMAAIVLMMIWARGRG